MKYQLTYKDESSDKSWNIETSGNSFTVIYGKSGTAGQTQTKSFENEETCIKEAEKLLKEKLKKGYKENSSSNYLETWKELCASKNIKEEFFKHFSFLAESNEDKEILSKLAAQVLHIHVDQEEALIVELKYNDPDFSELCEIRCNPPFTGGPPKGLPKSYVKTAQVHNGIYFEDLGGGAIGYFGISEKGKIIEGGWEPEALEEGDNEEYLETLEEKELSIDDIPCIIEFGQNWILSDPLKKRFIRNRVIYSFPTKIVNWFELKRPTNFCSDRFFCGFSHREFWI
ncbi:molybdate metabolism regulator [Leptospira mayottensis]|nr:WGR domain-containing protein [Leptospira mayottensis]AXR67800.1 molybdate metabolism regulator [Leptospira mayottensis]